MRERDLIITDGILTGLSDNSTIHVIALKFDKVTNDVLIKYINDDFTPKINKIIAQELYIDKKDINTIEKLKLQKQLSIPAREGSIKRYKAELELSDNELVYKVVFDNLEIRFEYKNIDATTEEFVCLKNVEINNFGNIILYKV